MKALLLLILAVPAGAMQSAPAAGTAGAAFLKLGAGARPMAMGGAYTAVADDAYSLYWNPAGLSRIADRGQVALFHDKWLGSLEHQFAALALTAPTWNSTFAVGVTRLGTNQKGYDAADRPTGSFSTTDLALSVAAARGFELFPARNFRAERIVHAGVAAKLISQSVPGESSTGFALDGGLLGTILENRRGSWTAGLSILNLGPSAGLGSEKSPLPVLVRLGTAYRLAAAKLTTSLDLEKARDNSAAPKLGLEWKPVALVAFRTGMDLSQPSSGVMDTLSFGGGVAFKGLEVGGSYVGHPDLGSSMLLDLKFHW